MWCTCLQVRKTWGQVIGRTKNLIKAPQGINTSLDTNSYPLFKIGPFIITFSCQTRCKMDKVSELGSVFLHPTFWWSSTLLEASVLPFVLFEMSIMRVLLFCCVVLEQSNSGPEGKKSLMLFSFLTYHFYYKIWTFRSNFLDLFFSIFLEHR